MAIPQNAAFIRDPSEIAQYTSDSLGGGLPSQQSSIIPRFFTELRPPPADGEGGPIEVELVELLIAGDSKNGPVHKVTEGLKARYREAYERFKMGRELAADGTPLEAWPMMVGRQSLLHVLKWHNIYTVEALAQTPDTGIQSIGAGALDLRKHAQAYVEDKRHNDPLAKQTQRVIELEKKLAMMQQQMAELGAKGEQKTEPEPEQPEPVKTEAGPVLRWNPGRKLHEVIVDGKVVDANADKAKAETLLEKHLR